MEFHEAIIIGITSLACGFVAGSLYMIRIRGRRVRPVYQALLDLRRHLESDRRTIDPGAADAYRYIELYIAQDYWECCREAEHMRRMIEIGSDPAR